MAVILESSANNPVVLSLMQFCRTLIELCGILRVTLSTHVIKCLFKVFGANVKGEKLQTFYNSYCYSTKIMKISLQYFEVTWERGHIYGRRFSGTEKLLFAWREAATKNTSAFPGYF